MSKKLISISMVFAVIIIVISLTSCRNAYNNIRNRVNGNNDSIITQREGESSLDKIGVQSNTTTNMRDQNNATKNIEKQSNTTTNMRDQNNTTINMRDQNITTTNIGEQYQNSTIINAPALVKAKHPAPIPKEIDYRELASPALSSKYIGKIVTFRALFLGEWKELLGYKNFGVLVDNKLFLNHRDISYKVTEAPLDPSATDSSYPDFPLGISVDKADIILKLNRGDFIAVQGTVSKVIPPESPAIKIRRDSIRRLKEKQRRETRPFMKELYEKQIEATKETFDLVPYEPIIAGFAKICVDVITIRKLEVE